MDDRMQKSENTNYRWWKSCTSSIGQNSGCSVDSMLFVELSGKQQKHKRYTMDDNIDILDPLTAHHRGFPKRRDNHLMEMPGTHPPANQNTHTHTQLSRRSSTFSIFAQCINWGGTKQAFPHSKRLTPKVCSCIIRSTKATSGPL
jgi:hypothetical protein